MLTSLNSIITSLGSGKNNKSYFQKASSNAATSAAGRWHEFFTASGTPSAGAWSGTAGVATQMTGSTQGGLSFPTADVSPDLRHCLNMKIQSPTATLVPATFYLVDFLLYYPACVVTGTATTLNNTATLPRYTNGEGVQCMIAVQTALGATQPVLTLTYTDEAGNTGNVAPTLTAPAASAPISTLFLNNGNPSLNLTGADRGIRKIDSYSLATGTTGTVAFVLFKILAEVDIYAINTGVKVNFLTENPSLPLVNPNACLGFIGVPGGAMVANSSISGTLDTVWG